MFKVELEQRQLMQKNVYWYVLLGILVLSLLVDLSVSIYRTIYYGTNAVITDVGSLVSASFLKENIPYFLRTAAVSIASSITRFLIGLYILCLGGLYSHWKRFKPDRHEDFAEETSDSYYKYFEMIRAFVLIPLMNLELLLTPLALIDAALPVVGGLLFNLILLKFYRRWHEKNKRMIYWIPTILALVVLIFALASPTIMAASSVKYEPQFQGYQEVMALADRVGFPRDSIYVTHHFMYIRNAIQIGPGRLGIVVIGAHYLIGASTDDLLGILAHELGHWKLGHLWITTFVVPLITFLTTFLFLYLLHQKALHRAFGLKGEQIPFGLAVLMSTLFLEYMISPICWIRNGISFVTEYQADAFAAKLGYGRHLIGGLGKVTEFNNHLVPNFLLFFYEDHPALGARVAAIRSIMGQK